MSSITKVALAGAKGNLGEAVLDQLLKAGFQVTALTRQGTTHTFPSGVTVKAVDYDSIDSLTDALQGQDAVVVTLGGEALGKQFLLIEAAVKAGVKRFIPSEFGSDTFNEKTAQLPGYRDKIEVQKAVKKAAAESGITWTAVACGPFLDWGVSASFLVNAKDRKIELPDGGNLKTSTTTLADVGRAVVGVLRNLEQTKNRVVYVQSAVITQRKLLEYVKKVVGSDGWTEDVTSIDEQVRLSFAEAEKENPNFWVLFGGTVKAAIWKEGYGGLFQKLDNDLLGVKQMTDAEVAAVVAQSVPK
ncbi:NAD(P)-binding protein [Hypoxylon crocopeplum]|nr:NAD(P)-binding protein [Hypoxylon crocopeplum]